MKVRNLIHLGLTFSLVAFFHGCEKKVPAYPEVADRCKHVLIMYSCGHNNLSSSLLEDINDIGKTSPFENYSNDFKVVAFSHSIQGRDFSIPVDPVLMQVYRDKNGKMVKDTLMIYPSKRYAEDGTPSEEGFTGSDPKTLETVLKDIRRLVPAENYGFLFTSHGTGWLPYNYYSTGEITKTAGADYSGYGWSMGVPCEIDVKDYAAAFRNAGMKVEYMMMDACFMGGVETAYQIKDICRYYIASQTEIWSDGLVYTTMTQNIFGGNIREGLVKLCQDYMANYRRKSLPATISMTDCSKLGTLSATCKDLFRKYRAKLDGINKRDIQVYLPTQSTPGWSGKTYFYDLEDILLHLDPDESEKSRLDAVMQECIVFKDATDKLFDGSALRHHGGLSMYLPCAGNTALSSYYSDFLWNCDTALVQ